MQQTIRALSLLLCLAGIAQGGATTDREFKELQRQLGARASKLFKLLEKGHYDVKLSPEDLHRIALWIDCNTVFYGAYENLASQLKGELVMPTLK